MARAIDSIAGWCKASMVLAGRSHLGFEAPRQFGAEIRECWAGRAVRFETLQRLYERRDVHES